jgi:3'-phosphoadenosine 5'-phosphosulfate sulfotransferase (PAPS reductase)/FAD synthetase
MKYIASCSFGKDSIASVILAHQNKEPLDIILYSEVMYDIEKDISGEVPEHREFIYNYAKPLFESWGYEVIVVKSEKDYKWNFNHIVTNSMVAERNGKKRGFPIAGMCAINRDSKIPPITKYYKENKFNSVTQYVGIAIDEPKRLGKLINTNKISLLEKYNFTEQMAKDMCISNNLLSPIYEFTDRGGCWFCPNCKDKEFKHMRDNHSELWQDLVRLGGDKNTISTMFNRDSTIQEIEERLMWDNAQMNIFDYKLSN